MSDTEDPVLSVKRIKQLENKNLKLRKLLDAAIEVINDDAAGGFKPKVVSDCEGENSEESRNHLEEEDAKLRTKLTEVLDAINKEQQHCQGMNTEEQLRDAVGKLEAEKQSLIRQIKDIEDNESVLSQESFILQERLSQLESRRELFARSRQSASSRSLASHDSISTHFNIIENTHKMYINTLDEHQMLESKVSQAELNKKIISSNTNLINKIKDVQSKLNTSLGTNCNLIKNLDEPRDSVDIDVQIAEMERQKEALYDQLEQSLEHSSKEISGLSDHLSDPEIKRLVHEIEIQKTVLLYNLRMLKLKDSLRQCEQSDEFDPEANLSNVPTASELDVRGEGTYLDEAEDKQVYVPSNNPPEPAVFNDDQVLLQNEIERLVNERAALLGQLRCISETSARRFEEQQSPDLTECLHDTFMKEQSSDDIVSGTQVFDDATNQMFADEDARLEQRIRELEIENDRIRKELDSLTVQIQDQRDQICTVPGQDLKEKIKELETPDSS
ncbi:unnamed protein product [Acanthoscelides obtectus]|uniref:Uncharacterized protein n=1 Tax=Acanthoscelides obtectus TaxID=200917 RepID=A0A9P0MGX4_ACAOB|nr:unnamed protein product [Acanthoscelides obtectus]CAK1680249.1 hypothetical protein AOBTE_LOCUS32546 [Acanthoscelides obtectus]